MIEVRVIGGDMDGALRIFKGKVVMSGLERELKQRRYFTSKSERRREQVRKGIRRARKRERRTEERG